MSDHIFDSAYQKLVTNINRVFMHNQIRFNLMGPHSEGAEERRKIADRTSYGALWNMMNRLWFKETNRENPVIAEQKFKKALNDYLKAEAFARFGNTSETTVNRLKTMARIQWLKKTLLEIGLQFDRDCQKTAPYNNAYFLLRQKQPQLVPIGIASGALASLWLVNRQRREKRRETERVLDLLDIHQTVIDDAIRNVNRAFTKKELANAIQQLSKLVQTSDSTPIIRARKQFGFFFVRGKKLVFTNDPKNTK